MRKLIFIFHILFFSTLTSASDGCGEPLAMAWDPYEKNWQGTLNDIGIATINQQRELIGEMSKKEERLYNKILDMPLFITHRLPTERLRSVLGNGALLSPLKAEENGKTLDVFTPSLEHKIFGAFSCVFATIGTPDGRERYGDVIIRLSTDKLPSKSWATQSSGYHHMKQEWGQKFSIDMPVAESDILSYARTLIRMKDWHHNMALQAVSQIRTKSAEEKEPLLKELLGIEDSKKFWAKIDQSWMGYLEVKIPSHLPLHRVEKIEIPSDKSETICNWPESENWRDLLGCNMH